MKFRGIITYQAIIVTFFIGLGIYFHFTNPFLLTKYTKEDGFIEWMTFLIFMSTFLFMSLYCLHYFLILKKPFFTIKSLGLLAVTFLFFFGAMEEISWLQRVIGIESSNFFAQHNAQAETNLHNLTVNGKKVNKIIFGKLLFLFVLIHNVILPLIARKKKNITILVDRFGFFLPHLGLVCIYVLGALFTDFFIAHKRAKEHMEVIGSLHYFSSIFIAYGFGIGTSGALFKEQSKKLITMGFIFYVSFMAFISWILGSISLKDFVA